MREVSLVALRAFEAAARTGSFRLAAAELNLTPSAISHAVRKLEGELGTTLFVREGLSAGRDRRHMAATQEGEVLMAHVSRGFAELRRGVAMVSASGPRLLRLHAAPSFAAQWLAPRLPGFLAMHPGVEVRLASGTDYRRFDAFDADIVYGEPLGDAGALSLGEETVTPLCSPAVAAGIETAADLLDRTLIESDNKRVRWERWFAANGLRAPAPRGPRFDRSFLAIGAAADGMGVALESLRLAERELGSGRLVRPLAGVAQDVRYRGHWLIFPAGRREGRVLNSFCRWLMDELEGTKAV